MAPKSFLTALDELSKGNLRFVLSDVAQAAIAAGTFGEPGAVGAQGPPGIPGAGMTWLGLWDVATLYLEGDGVRYEGSSWIALADNIGDIPPLSSSNWDLIASKGDVGMTWQGEYSFAITYADGDAVSYNGTSYIMLLGPDSGHAPDLFPTVWGVLAAKGSAGSTGATGQRGIQGPPGPQGDDGEDGIAGPPGVAGSAGPSGAPGAAGAMGIGVPGVDGDDGEQGYPGIPGVAGAAGSTGPTGPQGPAGFGVPGQDGDDGEHGWPGPTGPAGVAAAIVVAQSNMAPVADVSITAGYCAFFDEELVIADGMDVVIEDGGSITIL